MGKKIKSAYVRERLAEISLQEHGVVEPDPIRIRITNRPKKDPKEYFSRMYVRKMRRRDPNRYANWFDVDLAFKAGFDAAIELKTRSE